MNNRKFFNFTKDEINTLKKIFFNSKLIDPKIILETFITKEKINFSENVRIIHLLWGDGNYMFFSFKENSQFRFNANFDNKIYNSEFNYTYSTESEYNLKCLNYLEKCLNEIGLDFKTTDLFQFIFRQNIPQSDEC